MELPPSSRRATGSRLAGFHWANPSTPLDASSYVRHSLANLGAGEVQSSACCCRPTIRSVRAMPSLPRSPFGRRGRATAETAPERTEPRVDIVESPGLRWINVERPRSLEQAWLEERFEFHPLDYEDVRSRNQRPKVDEYEDSLFIVLPSPRYEKKVSRLNAAEVDIFVGPDFLIPLPNEPLDPISYLF